MTERVPRARRPEIDWLKGFAILCVLLIHAKPLEGYAIQDQLVNRAVPIFVVLFGMTSEGWWLRRRDMSPSAALVQWLRTRLRRLMVPAWGTLIVWWTMHVWFGRWTAFVPERFVMTMAGYWPWIGTGWFVTLVILLVVSFPLLHFLVHTLGDVASIVVAVVAVGMSYGGMFYVVALMRRLLFNTAPENNPFFYFWIFVPAWAFAVTVGIVVMRNDLRLRWWHTFVCVAIALVIGTLSAAFTLPPMLQRGAAALIDPFVALAMLGVVPMVRWWRPAARGLAWCGEWSWGIYLGQLLVHNAFFTCGVNTLAFTPLQRTGYFACLLVGAVGLAVVGEAVRNVSVTDWLPHSPTAD